MFLRVFACLSPGEFTQAEEQWVEYIGFRRAHEALWIMNDVAIFLLDLNRCNVNITFITKISKYTLLSTITHIISLWSSFYYTIYELLFKLLLGST